MNNPINFQVATVRESQVVSRHRVVI